jgi:alkylation response protein AidB-like acyl-CoA dehydrogenase
MAERAAGSYNPPLDDIGEALEVAGLPAVLALARFSHIDAGMVKVVLGELGRFAAEVIAPTDTAGDRQGARYDPATGAVSTPPGFADAYRRYVESGWGALQFPQEHGGGGFPSVVGLALQEMFASANMALSLNPVLTQGAVELLLAWGDDNQRRAYLPRLVTGEWSATMDLTEPDAGSDLGAVHTYAEPGPDGRWDVSGTKIFITWGEHDMAANIVHLVLARAPGGPPGTKGLSVFLVPKFVPGPGGEPGTPNSLRCARLEEKLGIHGAPTCVMEYDHARGELVGPLHGGMRAMFTMMNLARLSIGAEGPAVAERAYQQAAAYAASRRQGHRPGQPAAQPSPIIEHPDVARMLLEMRTLALASRLVLYLASASGDLGRHGATEADRARGHAYFDLLTPVAKAWCTSNGLIATSLGLQVYGGAGYVEETGIAQRLRDARIAPIYEGTNGIQAVDLVVRKVPKDDGRWVHSLLGDIAVTAARAADQKELGPTSEVLAEARDALAGATEWVLERGAETLDDVLAGASAYLELMGATAGGWLMAERALAALHDGARFEVAAGESNFFAVETLASARALARQATAGAERLAVLRRPG